MHSNRCLSINSNKRRKRGTWELNNRYRILVSILCFGYLWFRGFIGAWEGLCFFSWDKIAGIMRMGK